MVQKLNLPSGLGKNIVGLTGGFGSGKSTAAHLFEELGAFVIYADKLAHEAWLLDSPVYDRLKALLPEAALKTGEGFDLKKVAGIVFRDDEKRKKLESIIHPYVFDRIMEEITEAVEPVVVVEIPLLYETGFEQHCHQVIVVTASEEMIFSRLREKGFLQEDITLRQRAQWPLEEKVKKADRIINNSGTFQQTRRDVEEIWKKLHPASKGAV